MQVYELADELGIRSIDVLDAARIAGVPVRDAGSELDESRAAKVRDAHHRRIAAARADAAKAAAPPPPPPPPPPGHGGRPVAVGPNLPPPGPPPPDGGLVPPPPVGVRAKPPMHPLIRTAIWQFALAHVVPCIGLYWFFAAYINAGKGRRQVAWWKGKWGGDTAGQVIQILFWVELTITVVAILVALLHPVSSTPPPVTIAR